MKDKLAEANKALVAAVVAIVTAALPELSDAVSNWLGAVIGALIAGVAVYAVPNKNSGKLPPPPPPR